MDPAKADLLDRVWRVVVARKQRMTASIRANRSKLQEKGANVHNLLKEIAADELRLEFLDSIIDEASS